MEPKADVVPWCNWTDRATTKFHPHWRALFFKASDGAVDHVVIGALVDDQEQRYVVNRISGTIVDYKVAGAEYVKEWYVINRWPTALGERPQLERMVEQRLRYYVEQALREAGVVLISPPKAEGYAPLAWIPKDASQCLHEWKEWFTEIEPGVDSGSGLRCARCGHVLTLDDLADVLNGRAMVAERAIPGPKEGR